MQYPVAYEKKGIHFPLASLFRITLYPINHQHTTNHAELDKIHTPPRERSAHSTEGKLTLPLGEINKMQRI